eukprot:evm.model.scf_2131.1 EVM.evm.TU.scf_2131.1   scf_2131:9075-10388(+)
MSSKAARFEGSPDSQPPSPDCDASQWGARPTPEPHACPPGERPSKKQRTGRSNDENMGDQRLLRANREISRPGLLAGTDPKSFMIPDRPSPPYRPPDEDGYYVCELGDNLSSRYKVLARIGEGSFGRVLECWDRKKKKYVAIKVIRNIEKYRHAAMIEVGLPSRVVLRLTACHLPGAHCQGSFGSNYGAQQSSCSFFTCNPLSPSNTHAVHGLGATSLNYRLSLHSTLVLSVVCCYSAWE